jgi:putative oxidoreductase
MQQHFEETLMTTLFARSASVESVLPATRVRPSRIALWLVQVGVAGMFLFAGSLKLSGDPHMVAAFDAIGLGQWFRYVTGAIEVGAALALLLPPLAAFGALLLVPTMIGAIATHLFILGGSFTSALVLLVASAAIAWARRDELARALSRLQRQ